LRIYGRSLDWVLRRRALAATVWLVCLVGTIGLFMIVPKAFLPVGDSSVIFGVFIAREGSSPEQMQRIQDRADDVLHTDPNTVIAFTMTGNASFLSSNQGITFTFLRPPQERPPVAVVAGQLMRKMSAVPGLSAFLRPYP